MKAAEKDHVKAVGEDKFNRAVGLAMVEIRRDARLIGLDKTRNAMAEEAAFRATGYEARPFTPPKNAGDPSQEFLDLCAAILERATEAARKYQPAS